MSLLPTDDSVLPPADKVDGKNKLAQEYRKTVVEIHSQLFDKAATYSTLIMVGGYAGIFTIWGTIRAQLTDKANILVALLIGFSLCVFISYQVYKMWGYVRHFRRVRALLADNLPIQDFFEKYNTIEREIGQITLGKGTAASTFSFVACVAPAVLAIGLLFYNFFASLIGWPMFPADA